MDSEKDGAIALHNRIALAVREATDWRQRAEAAEAEVERLHTARPLSEWHEDYGEVLWWRLPVDEPPFCGSPLGSDWPGYHTHWTPMPPVPARPADGGAE